MTRDYTAGDLVRVVVDEYSCAILTAASSDPVIVNEIVDEVGMSPATAYRRIKQLVDCGLLSERTWIDESGTQCHLYEANFESIKLEIMNGIAYLHIVHEDTHTLTRIWEFDCR